MVKKSNVSAKTALLLSVCALLVSGFGITLVLRSRASPTTGVAQPQPVQVTFVSTNEAPIEPVPTAVLVAVTTGTVVIPTPKFFSDGPVELPTPVPTVPTPAATVAPEETFYRDARQKVQFRLQPGLVVMAPQEFNSSIRIQNHDTNEQPLRKSVNKVIVAELTFTQVRDKSLEAWATEQFKRELAFSAGAAGGFSGTDIQPIKLGEFSAYSFDRRGPMIVVRQPRGTDIVKAACRKSMGVDPSSALCGRTSL
jgi:hypothetical protein